MKDKTKGRFTRVSSLPNDRIANNQARHALRESHPYRRPTGRVAGVNEIGRQTNSMDIVITCARFGDLS